MTTILTEVYDAFISVGVSDDKARKAAEALSGQERRFDKLENTIDIRFADLEGRIDARFATIKSEMDGQFAKVDTRFAKGEGELLLLKWMMGFVLAFQAAIFAKLYMH